jgi:hypothetical protein
MKKETKEIKVSDALYFYGSIGYLMAVWNQPVPFWNKFWGVIFWPAVLGMWATHQWPK